MIDAHVHLEKGDYSVEWINQFAVYAVKRNIDEVYFLEHTQTNRFPDTIKIWSGSMLFS